MGNTPTADAMREWLTIACDVDAVEKTEAIVRRLIPNARFRYAGLGYATDKRPPDVTRDVWLLMDGTGAVLSVTASDRAYPPYGIRWSGRVA